MPIVIMLGVSYVECHIEVHYAESHYTECRYAEYRYAECHYAECRYAEGPKGLSMATGGGSLDLTSFFSFRITSPVQGMLTKGEGSVQVTS
jgi:hypothetical protein